jgi:hypothetical protein
VHRVWSYWLAAALLVHKRTRWPASGKCVNPRPARRKRDAHAYQWPCEDCPASRRLQWTLPGRGGRLSSIAAGTMFIAIRCSPENLGDVDWFSTQHARVPVDPVFTTVDALIICFIESRHSVIDSCVRIAVLNCNCVLLFCI